MKEYEFPEDANVTIFIKRDNDSSRNASKRKRGVIVPRRSETPMHRRTQAGIIRFFDGGYLRNDSGVYHLAMEPVLQNGITNADYDDLLNRIVTTGIDRAYQLDKTISVLQPYLTANGNIPFDVEITNGYDTYELSDSLRDHIDPRYKTKWSPTGLKLTKEFFDVAPFIQIRTSIGFGMSIQLKGSNQNKITKLASYSAPAVAFTPSNKMDIILVPSLVEYYGRSIVVYLISGVTHTNFIATNTKKALIPRELLYIIDAVDFGIGVSGTWVNSFTHTAGDAIAYNKVYRAAQISVSGYEVSTILSNMGQFPVPPAYPDYVGYPYPSVLQVIYNYTYPFTIPMAIIKQNGNVYYVWSEPDPP